MIGKIRQFLAFMMLLVAVACCGGTGLPDTSTVSNTAQTGIDVVQTGVSTAQAILDVLNAVLKPAVEQSKSLCAERTKMANPDRARALFACAQINDGWEHAAAAGQQLKRSMATGDQTKIDGSVKMLQEAIGELQGTLKTYGGAQ